MARDTRRGQKTNRKKVVKEVSDAQAASGVTPEKKEAAKSTPKPRPSRELLGADRWLRKFRNTLGGKAARDLFDMVGEPDRSCLELANKLLTSHCFLLMDAQRMVQKQTGKPGEEGARIHLEDCRKTARAIKDLVSSIVKLRGQYAAENMDTNPDVIELIGVENLRAQLTTTSATTPSENIH